MHLGVYIYGVESWNWKSVEKATFKHYPTAKFIDLIKKCQLQVSYEILPIPINDRC